MCSFCGSFKDFKQVDTEALYLNPAEREMNSHWIMGIYFSRLSAGSSMLADMVNPLRKWRHGEHYTEAEVGEYLGVTRATVNKWELGKACPLFASFRNMAEMMGMRIGTLTEKWANWKDQEDASRV